MFGKDSNLHFNLISLLLVVVFIFFLQKPVINSPAMPLLLELLRQRVYYIAVQKGRADR